MRKLLLLILAALFLADIVAARTIRSDSTVHNDIFQSVIDYGSLGIGFTRRHIDRLDEKDTAYITPNLYNFTLMAEYSYWYEYYRFQSNTQTLSFAPDMRHRIGLYVGWRWIFLGWSFDVEDILGHSGNSKTDLNFSFYTSKVGIDIFYRKTGNDFKIREAKGFYDPNTGNGIADYPRSFSGLSVNQRGLNLYYIFNHKHFSYPAAYSQSTNQRISCGSFIGGFSLSRQIIRFDEQKLPPSLLAALDSSLLVNKVAYHDYSLNFGYSYNWVFAKNCLANLSLTPAIAYKHSTLKSSSNPDFKSILDNVNFDFIARIGLVYNNAKYYAGFSFVGHAYTYRRDKFSLLNSFGVLRIYSGINLWRKKQK